MKRTLPMLLTVLVPLAVHPLPAQGWEALDPGTHAHLMDITFVNDSVGWIVGFNGTILHTTDGGDTWAPQTSGTTLDLYGVHFRNVWHGWAVGENGIVLGTLDGGKTWSQQFLAEHGRLYDVAFQDEQYGWAVGFLMGETGGTLVRTGNGGQSWSVASGPTECHRVKFLDSQTGWMVGLYGKAYRTTDGGGYWREFMLCPGEHCWDAPFLQDVYFIDPSHGWIAGDSGGLFQTTDSGNTWIDISPEVRYNYNIVHFINQQRGILLGHMWTVYYPYPAAMMLTSDGGANWREVRYWLEDTGYLGGFHGADFTSTFLYAVGLGGTLIRIPLATLAVDEPPLVPTAFHLYQNYPNPFNPATTIRYELPQAAQVTLAIYDLLGREVATLVDGYIQPGTHEAVWDAGSFPSGIYLARLTTPGYSKTIKLVLLK
ncbi:YCF48-related protein [Candidatus Neomarinimicrobiota bacterium]